MTDILRTIDLSKRFRNTVALDHLNMSVPEHSVYGLVGPNGAGKTTTIKILMNILQTSEGTAEIFGRDSRKLSPQDFTQIGYVSENQQMPEWMTVEYLMNYLKPFYPNWDSARAAELLRQFDLPLDRKIPEFVAWNSNEGCSGFIAGLQATTDYSGRTLYWTGCAGAR